MCGRFLTNAKEVDYVELFGPDVDLDEHPIPVRFNVAPTQEVAIVRRQDDGRRRISPVRWGLVPGWAKDPLIGSRLINARAETLAAKPAFRDAFKRRRCVVPATGFYEWQQVGKGKQPWLLQLKGGRLFGFAGLWSSWTDRATGEVLETCAIVTTAPNELARPLHDRMPAILARDGIAVWLDPAAGADALTAALAPFPAEAMEAWPVSTLVNSPANDRPELIERLDPGPPAALF
jgi:putative SOS response-associated peptidase YedK